MYAKSITFMDFQKHKGSSFQMNEPVTKTRRSSQLSFSAFALAASGKMDKEVTLTISNLQ